jgi:hypothetical protein
MPDDGNGFLRAERLAANAWFTNIGRAAAIAGLPLLGTMGWMIIDVRSDVRVLSAQVTLGMTDSYRGADATRDLKFRDLEIDTLKHRVDQVERAAKPK